MMPYFLYLKNHGGYFTGSGLDTPCSEPGFSATELWDAEWDSEPEDLCSNTRQVSFASGYSH